MKLFLLFLCLIPAAVLMLSCSFNQSSCETTTTPNPIQYQIFEAPSWLFQIPKGPYVVGISWSDGMIGTGAEDSAREHAAVSLSRNHASFVVDKSIIVSLSEQRELDWNQVGYNVVVSANLQAMHDAYANLKLVDSYDKNGYFIGLFSYNTASVDSDLKPMTHGSLPAWAKGNDISTDSKNVFGVGSSHQAYLMDAWSEAQENALKAVGKYRLQNIMGRILAIDDMLEKSIAMETVTQSNHVYLDKAWIVHIRNHQTSSYRVYLRLMAEK